LNLSAIAAGDDPEPTNYDANGETWSFDVKDTLRFMAAARSNWVLRAQFLPPVAPGAPPPTALFAPEGAVTTVAFRPSVVDGVVTARFGATGTLGTVSLRCGNASQSVDMGVASRHAIAATLSIRVTRADPCSFSVRWRSFDFGFLGATIHASGRFAQNWETLQYFSGGTYTWNAMRGSSPLLAIDGIAWKPGEARRLAAGRHLVRLLHASFPLPALFFRRQEVAGDVPNVTALEAAHLNDGFWFAGATPNAVRGYACDLINTCFDTAADGPVVHAAPPPLALGLSVTGTDVVACVALTAIGLLRRGRKGEDSA
jgi:hypothetical protein